LWRPGLGTGRRLDGRLWVRRTICWKARCGRCGESRSGAAGILFERGEVSHRALEAVEEGEGAAGIDLTTGEGIDDLR
jgi:hypothetical protein